jgi:chromosome segregation ATPase
MSSSSSDSTGQSRSATSTTTSVTDRATASSTPSPGTNLATSAEQNASSLWREFQDVTKKIFRHRRMYDEIERTMERQSAMEAKVQEQQDRISNLESNQQSQLHSFEKRYDTWKQEKVRLESEKKKAEGEMTAEHTRKMEDMKQQLRRETGRADFLAKEQERAKKEANLAKNELEVCKSRLQFWECHTSRLKDVNFDSLLVIAALFITILVY